MQTHAALMAGRLSSSYASLSDADHVVFVATLLRIAVMYRHRDLPPPLRYA